TRSSDPAEARCLSVPTANRSHLSQRPTSRSIHIRNLTFGSSTPPRTQNHETSPRILISTSMVSLSETARRRGPADQTNRFGLQMEKGSSQFIPRKEGGISGCLTQL